MQVYCSSCKQKTNHETVVEPFEQKSSIDDDIQWSQKYYIVKCKGCNTVAFLEQYGDEEMWEASPWAEGEREYTYTYTTYPAEPLNKDEFYLAKEFYKVPKFIKELYSEVVDSYNNKSLILCSVGLRMIIEGICKEKGIDREVLTNRDGTPKTDNITGEEKFRFLGLEEKLNLMLERDLITPIQSRTLHQIREMGNETAHEITKHDVIIILGALQVLENLLYNIYDLASIELFKRK
ncbi:DUF4145 domain-containing protein [Paenibacillus endoradicis]|uniref:DUF4145 domain-containing protein n=1 Tax=Paenibacillus endoradicis TaxID=2972487 RepID=UPI002159965C|nr:DUF4145 domain-containing protein [Paenibacillus endoradicis]MCR8659321.1 DUF4145 domain-containing protein [Paenibacillus endoradicis]